MDTQKSRLLRVGELAKAVGKSVRAIHLYEELGLLQPIQRTSGGFRLFQADAIDRINWITKLQAIGFSLTEIQGFVREFESAESGRSAAARVRDIFQDKLRQTRNSLAQLQVVENDLVEALEYLDSCQHCAPMYGPHECRACDHEGHSLGEAPELFAGLSSSVVAAVAGGAPAGEPIIELGRVRAPVAVAVPAADARSSGGRAGLHGDGEGEEEPN